MVGRCWLWLLLPGMVACADPPPPRELVVRAGFLLDGTGRPAQADRRLHIRDGQILSITADTEPWPVELTGATVIDARHQTVLPGLVDSHVRLFDEAACPPPRSVGGNEALVNLHAQLRAGVTTVADLGTPTWLALALRRHVGTARHRGPRLLVAGPWLSTPGAPPLRPAEAESNRVRRVVTTLSARAAVNQLAIAGVDLIAVRWSVQTEGGQPPPALETLCAVVGAAHQQELRALAHVSTNAGYRAALDCTVDAIVADSPELLDDELLERLVTAQIPITFDAPATHDPEVRAKVRANTQRLYERGAALGFATGAGDCATPHGNPTAALHRLGAAGLSPVAALRVASHGGARMLGLQDAIGQLTPGFRADLIGVDGRPDQRLDDLGSAGWVVLDGVVQNLDGPGWGEKTAWWLRRSVNRVLP